MAKSFGKRAVFSSLDASFEPGTSTAVIGPNGSGKSTLLRMIWGELEPDSGTMIWEGRAVRPDSESWRRIVGAVPDDDALIEGLSIMGHFSLCAALSGLDAKEAGFRAGHLVELFGLGRAVAETRSADEASRGNRKRLACALALLGEPRLVVMDEPFSGLDAESAASLSAIFSALASRGRAVVFSCHDEGLTRSAADRYLMIRGRRGEEPAEPRSPEASSGPTAELLQARTEAPDLAGALPWLD